MKRTVTIFLTLMLTVCTSWAQTGEHERGLLSMKPAEHPYVQKGSWSIGGVYNLSAMEVSPSMFYKLKLKPEISFAVADDMELGVRGRYTRGLANVVQTLGIENYRLLGHEYGAELFGRKYLTIGNSGRLAVYVDAALGAKAGQSIVTESEDGVTSGSYKTNKALYLNVEPGLIVSVAPWLAISGGLSMASVGYGYAHQVHNQVDEGIRSGVEASYALNPLELSVASHIYLNNHRRYESSSCMIKKGQGYGNMSVSFAKGNSAASQVLLVANDLDGNGTIVHFTPELGYAYKDDASIGVRVSLATGVLAFSNLNLNVPGMGISLDLEGQAVEYMSNGMSVYHRNYKGLDRNGNFGVFFENSLGASSINVKYNGDSILDQQTVKAVFSPGIMIYVLPFVSLEASAGIADLRWSPGAGNSFGAGFHVNPLNCRLGVSFHI